MKYARHERSKGFTLTELLVTVVIIGILAGIAMPVFLNQKAKGERASVVQELSELSEIANYMLTDGQAITTKNYVAGESFSYGGRALPITRPTTVVATAGGYCIVVSTPIDSVFYGIDSDSGQKQGSTKQSVCPGS